MALTLACVVMGCLIPLFLLYILGEGPFAEKVLEKPPEVLEVAPVVAPTAVDAVPLISRQETEPENPAYPFQGVHCTGFMQRGEQIIVFLSDGTQVRNGHPALGPLYSGSHVMLGGKAIPIRPRQSVQKGAEVLPGISVPGQPIASQEPRMIWPTITIGPEIDPNLPKPASGESFMRKMIREAESGIQSMDREAREMLKDKMHHEKW